MKTIANPLVPVVFGVIASLSACSGERPANDQPHAGGMEGMPGMEGTPGMEGMPGMEPGSERGTVQLSAEELVTFGVTFGSAETRPLSRTVRAVGTVEFDEARVARVAPKFGGWAERLDVAVTGQNVRSGSPLLEVYAPELVAAQEELLLAASMLESARSSGGDVERASAEQIYAAARRRLEYWDVSARQIDEVLAAGQARRTLTLEAPVSGVVIEKSVVRGQSFEAGASLYTVADLSRVWVIARIFEADFGVPREGLATEVTVAGIEGRSFSGPIEYVYPTVGDDTRSLRARIPLPNPDLALKPGMFATVTFTASLGEVLTVPASAVLHTGQRDVIFIDLGGGSLAPREVEVGSSGDEFVQVLAGVEPGQRVVTSAQFLLDSESNLAQVMRAMMAQMNLSDMGR